MGTVFAAAGMVDVMFKTRNRVYYAAESNGGDWFVYNADGDVESCGMSEEGAYATAERWNKKRRARTRPWHKRANNKWTRVFVYALCMACIVWSASLRAVFAVAFAYLLGVMDTADDQ